MSATVIRSNAKEFVAKLNKVSKAYHQQIMLSLAESMDEIRFQAADNLVPRKIPEPKSYNRISMLKMWKLQPPTPGKLTERTGRLIDVLKSGGRKINNWRIPRTIRQAVLRNVSRHLMFKIVPQVAQNSFFYLAQGRLRPTGEVQGMSGRISQEKRGGRKFWSPAVAAISKNVDRNMFRDLRKTWDKTL